MLICQPVVFIRQRTQGLGQQPRLLHVDIEIALAGFMQRTARAHDVAEIPALDMGERFFIQCFAIHIQLDLVGAILYQQEGAAIAHQSARHGVFPVFSFEFLLAALAKLLLQLCCHGGASEVVGKRKAPLAQTGELHPPLGNQPVFLLRRRRPA